MQGMLFDMPKNKGSIIKVLGVGGGGSNAVTHMFKQGIVGVDFAICNTDVQAMEASPVPIQIPLGTEGLGAGSHPSRGKEACESSIDEVCKYLGSNCKMLFVTAGMGGGTGTGAAPIIAKTAREMGILTVGIVTLPFNFEGRRRVVQGVEGLSELRKNVDTIIIISNDKLRQIYGNLSVSDAFAKADNILTTAAKGIAEIITVPGYVNVDFEDVRTVMSNSGMAIMGTASAEGDDRARRAVDEALHSPLLEENDIRGARHILLNITSGRKEVTMDEIFEITEFVQEEAGYGTDLIWGNCFDERLGDKVSVTIIATGFNAPTVDEAIPAAKDQKIKVPLDDDDVRQKKDGTTRFGLKEITQSEPDHGKGSNTVEFDNIRSTIEKYQRGNKHGYDEPFVKEENDRMEEERRRRQEMEQRRKERMRSEINPQKLNNPQSVNNMESEPAYMRRGIHLDDVPAANEQAFSRWTISDDEELDISERNSFLDDRVD
jgi:cell division protein FtsZ